MTINNIILRKKSSTLINSPKGNMGIEIDNIKPEIIDKKENNVYLIKNFNLRIIDNDQKFVIAEFKLIFQSEISLIQEDENFEESYNKSILPMLFMQINDMVGEMNLPRIDFKQFSNIINNH